MSTVNSYITCLTDDDLEKCNLKPSEETNCGICEDCDEGIFSLYTGELSEISKEAKDLLFLTKEELFESNLRPGDRMFLTQLVENKKNINLYVRYRNDKLVTAYERTRINPFVSFFKHLHTINRHRRLVRKHCFKAGLYYQGLVHDLSKYSPTEFFVGVKYYQGTRSPNVAERNMTGISTAWIHHKGRNKHHYEYWTDYDVETGDPLSYKKMPRRYFVESLMDRIAACKVYRGKSYTDGDSLDYLLTRDSESHMNREDYEEMLRLLTLLKDKGESYFFDYIKTTYLK